MYRENIPTRDGEERLNKWPEEVWETATVSNKDIEEDTSNNLAN